MSGLFGAEPIDQLATWVAALATLVVLGGMLGERRLFGVVAAPAGRAGDRLPRPAGDHRGDRAPAGRAARSPTRPGGRSWWLGLGLVAVTAATPWLPRIVGAVPLSIAIGALAAFALGGAVVGTLLPQLAAAVARPEPELAATVGECGRGRRDRASSLVGFLHGVAARPDPRCRRDRAGRWLMLGGIGGWLGYLLLSRLVLLHRPPRLPARRLAGAAVMTASVVAPSWRSSSTSARRGSRPASSGGREADGASWRTPRSRRRGVRPSSGGSSSSSWRHPAIRASPGATRTC